MMAGNVGEKIVADPHFWNFGKLTDILADIRYWTTQAKGPTLTIRDGPFALWRAVWDEKVQGILYGLESEKNVDGVLARPPPSSTQKSKAIYV